MKRSKIDVLSEGHITDMKSATTKNSNDCSKASVRLGSDLQS